MPVLTFHTDQQSDHLLASTITRWAKQKSVMSAISVKSENGLIKGHSYTILSVVSLQKNGEEVQQLVKMRSPWIYSNEIYSGPWNVKDAKWTKTFKKQVKFPQDPSEGIFFMTFDDF
jgi:hypothetical protein